MPKQVDHDEERRKLIITTIQCIADKGILAFNLRDLASSHGVTKGCVQHYYSSKEELLLATLDYVEMRFTELMASDITDNYELACHRLFQMIPIDKEREDLWRVKLAFSVLSTDKDDIHKSLNNYYRQELRLGTRLFKKAQAQYCFHQGFIPGEAYRSLMALVTGCALIRKNANPFPPSAQRAILDKALDDLML